jgi:surfactin synthase thioesterase subunit
MHAAVCGVHDSIARFIYCANEAGSRSSRGNRCESFLAVNCFKPIAVTELQDKCHLMQDTPMRDRVTSWFPYRKLDAQRRLRVFCLPYAGGSASMYCHWMAWAPRDVEIVPIELPGRWAHPAEPSRDLPRLVAQLADAIEPQLDRPFVMFGYSMGALLQFELARELRRRALATPACLIAAAANAPSVVRFSGAPSRDLSDDQFWSRIERQFGAVPSALLDVPELAARALRTLRADFALLEGYRYTAQPALGCPIVALTGSDDAIVPLANVELWQDETTTHFALHVVAGGHFFIREHARRVLQVVLESVRAELRTYASTGWPGRDHN